MEPLADVITLLRPRAVETKVMHGAGRWSMRRSRVAYAGFGLVLAGECWLTVDGHETLRLATGDFVLMPAGRAFTIASDLACEVISLNAQEALACQAGEVRYGDPDLEPEFKQLGGYFELDSVNRSLLGDLLPTLIHIQASDPAAGRLKRTIDSIVEEALAERPGRDLVVDRLVEVLLVEALRFRTESVDAIGRPGLLVGLADPLLARALRRLHGDVAHAWSVEEMAKVAGLSRSAFSERFGQKVGVPPMQYLIEWRMALAKAMLLAPRPANRQPAATRPEGSIATTPAGRAESPGHRPSSSGHDALLNALR
ncbi:cupin domain-containing protein [Bradyrhizobium genosp. P]|uniref:AraC family transcriptional regulator n=1 Tax=Bradyrhizobium genosp. P TaxID=83641 RepID=UPI003CF65BD3